MARGRVVFQASSTTMLVEAASAGLGIAGLPTYLAGDRPELVPIMPSRCDDFEVWLVAHADLYKTARMQLLITAIAEEFAAYQRSLLGDRDRQGMP
jgi:DNA-binding transcriptional LysR family regulator